MELKQIYISEYGRVEVNNAHKYIQVTWFKNPQSADFRDLHTHAVSYANAHNITRWLCDMRLMLYLEIKDQNWLVQEIFKIFNPELKHAFAYVVNSVGLELMTSIRVHNLVQTDPELQAVMAMEIFMEFDSAKFWLFETAQ